MTFYHQGYCSVGEPLLCVCVCEVLSLMPALQRKATMALLKKLFTNQLLKWILSEGIFSIVVFIANIAEEIRIMLGIGLCRYCGNSMNVSQKIKYIKPPYDLWIWFLHSQRKEVRILKYFPMLVNTLFINTKKRAQSTCSLALGLRSEMYRTLYIRYFKIYYIFMKNIGIYM